ncbi:MAG: hypothetical protein ABIQ44_12210 [Chloroflexia bacterium]
MSFEVKADSLDVSQLDRAYLTRRVREEAVAAASAQSTAATLIHVALSTAYAKRCRYVADQAWVAEHRVW